MAAAALIIEDGTGVTGANSYATVAALREYADDYGVTTLPVDDAAVAPLLFKAMAYIEAKEHRFSGSRSCLWLPLNTIGMFPLPQTQALSWPRTCASESGFMVPNNVIPQCLVLAQCQLACDASGGNMLMPTVAGTGNLKVKVRGPIKDEYFAPGVGTVLTRFVAADALLRRLYRDGGIVGTARA